MESLNLVPQIFYDLIARVIPGGIAIFSIALAVDSKATKIINNMLDGSPNLQQSTVFLTIIVLVLSYIVGHLIAPFSNLLSKNTVKRYLPSYFHVLKDTISTSNKKYPEQIRTFLKSEIVKMNNESDATNENSTHTQAVYIWFDWLRINNADVGARLTKLRAEYAMHEEIAGAICISIIIHIIAIILSVAKLNGYLLVGGLLLVIMGLVEYARAYRRFQWSTLNHYYLEHMKAGGQINPLSS